MGNILRRRGMMVPGESTPREWDYEWLPSMGKPEDNGMTLRTEGTYSNNLYNTYIALTQGGSSNYIIYNYPNTYQTGVAEYRVSIQGSNAKFYLYFGNGTYGIGARFQYSSSYKGIYLGPGTTTKLITAELETVYKVKLVLKGTTGDVYVDDVLLAEDVDVTAMAAPDLRCAFQATGSNSRTGRVYSIRYKFNRTA